MKNWTVESLSLAGAAFVLVLGSGATMLEIGAGRAPTAGALLMGVALAGAGVLLMLVRRLATGCHRRLAHSRAAYRSLLDTAHEGLWQLDLHGHSRFANRRLGQMLACRADDLAERSIFEFFSDNPRDLLAALLAGDERHAGQAHDLRYRRADGASGWASASSRPLFDEAGQRIGALLMLTDISSRKAAELELADVRAGLDAHIRERTDELTAANAQLRDEIGARQNAQRALADSEQRLRDIVATMPIPMILKDADSRIVMINRAATDQSGMPFPQVLGTRGEEWYPPEQMMRFLAVDRAVFDGRKLIVSEQQVWNCALNANRVMQVFKQPIFDAGGTPQYLICMYFDITEQRHADDSLQQSFKQLRQLTAHLESIKDQERRRIALDIHDDLGQNLLALKIDVEMLQTRTGQRHPRLNSQLGRVIGTLDATIRSVRTIINDLHPSTLELGLPAALEWTLAQFEQHSGIATALTVIGDGDAAPQDSRRNTAIFRIVQDSLLNILRHAAATQLEVTLHNGADALAITIVDDGRGVHPDDAGKEASFGLHSVRARVDAFGGQLALDNRPGDGATLTIMIPAGASVAAALE